MGTRCGGHRALGWCVVPGGRDAAASVEPRGGSTGCRRPWGTGCWGAVRGAEHRGGGAAGCRGCHGAEGCGMPRSPWYQRMRDAAGCCGLRGAVVSSQRPWGTCRPQPSPHPAGAPPPRAPAPSLHPQQHPLRGGGAWEHAALRDAHRRCGAGGSSRPGVGTRMCPHQRLRVGGGRRPPLPPPRRPQPPARRGADFHAGINEAAGVVTPGTWRGSGCVAMAVLPGRAGRWGPLGGGSPRSSHSPLHPRDAQHGCLPVPVPTTGCCGQTGAHGVSPGSGTRCPSLSHG